MNILIATSGRPELLEETLLSVVAAAQSVPECKIVVVENGGQLGAEQIINRVSSSVPIIYRSESQPNKSHALNCGLTECDDGLVFMTDDDVILEPQTLTAYHNASTEADGPCYFGGGTEVIYESEPSNEIRTLLPMSAVGLKKGHKYSAVAGHFLGFNWAAYKRDLIEAGGFNPDFGPGSKTGATGQESEMQRTLMASGLRGVWVDGASVRHVVPVERCNVDWVIRRGFRSGVEYGIMLARKDLNHSIRTLRKLTIRGLLRGVLFAVLRNEDRKILHRFRSMRVKGVRHGVSLVREGKLRKAPFYPFVQ